MTTAQLQIYNSIERERDRQDRLQKEGKFAFNCADRIVGPAVKLAILMEEVGEVAEIINSTRAEKFAPELKEELIQVAAVVVGWLESIA